MGTTLTTVLVVVVALLVLGLWLSIKIVKQYERDIDPIFEDMSRHGWRLVDRNGHKTAVPTVHVGRDGELILSNNGNHRLAMAKVLDLPYVYLRLGVVHKDAPRPLPWKRVEEVKENKGKK